MPSRLGGTEALRSTVSFEPLPSANAPDKLCFNLMLSIHYSMYMNWNVPTIIHPCSGISISLDVYGPKPRQWSIPLPTHIRCYHRCVGFQILTLQSFIMIEERSVGTEIKNWLLSAIIHSSMMLNCWLNIMYFCPGTSLKDLCTCWAYIFSEQVGFVAQSNANVVQRIVKLALR